MNSQIFQTFGVALGLGLLVGLQRERVESRVAGIRTFPLITLLGTICAYLAESYGGWVVAAGFVGVTAMLAIGNMAKLKEGPPDPGQTTEAALLLMFGVGAYLVAGNQTAAVVVGATVAVLLYLKKTMQGMVKRFDERDIKAVMQFVTIAMIVLPLLPDQTYGPYDVINPREIWWMVVLIVGISITGYIIYRFLGEKAGTILSGILGGMISSTATTVSYSRRTREAPGSVPLTSLVIMIASTIAFGRVLVEVAVVAPGVFADVAPPLAAMGVLMFLISVAAYFFDHEPEQGMPEQSNPAELKTAVVFALLYAIVILGVAAAKDYFGEQGLYAVAVISGLTDVDAITLSTSQLMNDGRLEAMIGWRLIFIASMANLFFKGCIAAVLGGPPLLKRISLLFGTAVAGGAAILLFW